MGVTQRQVRTALARGELVRLRHGVYVAGNAVPRDAVLRHLLMAAAHQVAAPRLIACDETAALALGVPLRAGQEAARGPLRFAQQGGGGRAGQRDVRVRVRRADLPPEHVCETESGLVVTTPARTAVDIALGLLGAARRDSAGALIALDGAARMQLHSFGGSRWAYRQQGLRESARAELAAVAGAVGRGRRGRALEEVLSWVDVRHETPIESAGAAHFEEAGLPESIPQFEIRTEGGLFIADRYFLEFGVVVEFDGEVKYAGARATILEKEREWHLRDRGHEVVRCTGREILFRPARMVDRVERVLRVRGWRG